MTGPIRLIAGSGRSGTTWIQDALAKANSLRPIFEPLHPYVSAVGSRYAHRALSADEDHPDLASYLLDTCAGGGPRIWTRYRQQWRWLMPPIKDLSTRDAAGRCLRHWSKYLTEMPRLWRDGLRRDPLVKCIRANLMLPWIASRLGWRIILVIRHPGAVVESEVRSGWNAEYALGRFRSDGRLHELTQGRYAGLLARQLEPVEALALRWVIENQWIIEGAAAQGIAVIHYEDLRTSDRAGWARLCTALDLSTLPDAGELMRPSQQSGSGRAPVPLDQSGKPRWMSRLDREQTAQVRGILEEVEFEAYEMHDPLPRRRAGREDTAAAAMAAP